MVMVRSGFGKKPAALVGPFDQAQRIVFEVITDAEVLQLLRIDQAIQVEMEGPDVTDLVRLDQSEGRTFDRALHAPDPG